MTNANDRHSRDFVSSRLRLRNYDYSSAGFYFVTICCQDRVHYLGQIETTRMELSAAGKMVDGLWQQLPPEFAGVTIDSLVTMPNHVHVLVGIGVQVSDPFECSSLIDVMHWFKSKSTSLYIAGVKSAGWPQFN